MTVLQLVDEVRTMTDAEQWIIVAGVALLVVSYTFWVGLAVVLVARTVVSIGRRAAAKIRGLAGRAESADMRADSADMRADSADLVGVT
jgi:hypothetical protein